MNLHLRLALPLAAAVSLAACTTVSEPPKAYLDLRDRGLSQMQGGNYQGASAAFRDAVTRFPRETLNPDLDLLRSDCEYQLGNEGEARRLRERVAREAIPADLKMRALLGLAMMDFRKERYDAAAENFQAAAGVGADPRERAKLNYQSGLSLQRGGRFAEARGAYKKAIELAPGSDWAGRSRMQILYPDHFLVQTGAFSRAANAAGQREVLVKKGFPAEVAVLDAPKGQLHCVWVGKLKKRSEAVALLERIEASRALPQGAKISVKP